MQRYKSTPQGDLIDQDTGNRIQVKDWRVEKHNMLVFMDGGGQPRRIARRMIDETSFSFGASPNSSSVPAVRKSGTEISPAAEQLVTMTKDELLQIHHALQSSADLTLQKLVSLIKG